MFRFLHKYESCIFNKQKFGKRLLKLKYVRLKSYYHALGLDSTASGKDIKSAYYKLSLQYHPDKNEGSEESVAKFREITEAYEVLGNPEKKKKYDQEYNFQPYYTENYKHTVRRSRPSNYQGPHTGKTKDFDYDEHFRKHYEDDQRQSEYEYFKRRWEADFHRRYPTHDDYYRNRYRREERYEWDGNFKNAKRRAHVFYVIVFMWSFFFIISSFDDLFGRERRNMKPSPLYYEVKNQNGKSSNVD